jgi:hypothetical protein
MTSEPALASARVGMHVHRQPADEAPSWYVLELLEAPRDGLSEHTRQGWNIGAVPNRSCVACLTASTYR